MDVKVGDTVHVRGVVDMRGGMRAHGHSGSEGLVRVTVSDEGAVMTHSVWVHPDQIVHVEPRALAVGDTVWRTDRGCPQLRGVLKAIAEDYALVRWDDCETWRAHRLSDLVRA